MPLGDNITAQQALTAHQNTTADPAHQSGVGMPDEF